MWLGALELEAGLFLNQKERKVHSAGSSDAFPATRAFCVSTAALVKLAKTGMSLEFK